MVKAMRELGKVDYTLTKKKKKGREFSRSLYVVEDIKAGEVITEKNVRSIRPGFGLHPKNLSKFLGKTVIADIEKGTRASFNLIK